MSEEKEPHRIYAVIVESDDQWSIAMLGVPLGTDMPTIQLMAEAHIARDEEVPPEAKIRLVMPIEPLLGAMEDFRKILTKLGAQEQFLG
jgi:hypothetical protein